MKKRGLILSVIAAGIILALSLSGCGGSSSVVSDSTTGTVSQTGSLRITVEWPDYTEESKITTSVIQPVVDEIIVRVTSGVYDQTQTISSPAAGGTENLVFTNIPTGTATVEASGEKADNTVISHRLQQETISNYTTTNATLHLGVSIRDTESDFYPAIIPVSISDTIYWVNNDTVAHTLTFVDSDGQALVPAVEPIIAAGASWSHTFSTAGTYTYTSSVGGYPTGTVQVYQANNTGNLDLTID